MYLYYIQGTYNTCIHCTHVPVLYTGYIYSVHIIHCTNTAHRTHVSRKHSIFGSSQHPAGTPMLKHTIAGFTRERFPKVGAIRQGTYDSEVGGGVRVRLHPVEHLDFRGQSAVNLNEAMWRYTAIPSIGACE